MTQHKGHKHFGVNSSKLQTSIPGFKSMVLAVRFFPLINMGNIFSAVAFIRDRPVRGRISIVESKVYCTHGKRSKKVCHETYCRKDIADSKCFFLRHICENTVNAEKLSTSQSSVVKVSSVRFGIQGLKRISAGSNQTFSHNCEMRILSRVEMPFCF